MACDGSVISIAVAVYGVICDDLPHHAIGIEHGLADEHTIAFAFVHQHLMSVGIEIHGHQFGDQDAIAGLEGRFQQFAQPAIFRFQRIGSLQACLQQ